MNRFDRIVGEEDFRVDEVKRRQAPLIRFPAMVTPASPEKRAVASQPRITPPGVEREADLPPEAASLAFWTQ